MIYFIPISLTLFFFPVNLFSEQKTNFMINIHKYTETDKDYPFDTYHWLKVKQFVEQMKEAVPHYPACN